MKKSVNKIELSGIVGQDARIISVGNGYAARFSLATNEIIKGKDGNLREETMWHNIVAWSSQSMPNFNEIKKGSYVEVHGKLRYVKYTNTEGIEKVIAEINALELFIHNKK